MKKNKRIEALELIDSAQKITFLTGAGISVPSGIPDYRSLAGVYQGMNQPEYLLSRTCLEVEPTKFYQFVRQLYHPTARPNRIHCGMKKLEKSKDVQIITQNIDQLHLLTGSQNVVSFHGNLYKCYCMSCGKKVAVKDYLKNDKHHQCGGQLRPDIVLYEEGLRDDIISAAISGVSQAELLVIVGTSFRVSPFCQLLQYKKANCPVIAVNQEVLDLEVPFIMVQEDAMSFFEEVEKRRERRC
ncbi:NAD-dependent protein deacylase [Vagococcus intermedius]|uniref:protein acetyllysine N-acetyltransferase n=1 Tax=Vagococcus intermedius TaxID=2991418 RepID=A0AAF0I7E3_9ENTE|nr:NAD-dependent protein deacylase [Vagococcus intermedius]WEG73274.1 NAD-dependent protein deacylase [Vagococcus intermedius]WEG75356.1 NAD-dependent protein deacylase [Vagococcus intermedius]